MRKKIVVDIDEVVLDYVNALLKHLNEKFNMNIKKKQIKSWNITSYYPIPEEKLIYEWERFCEKDSFSNLRLINNAKEGIKKLSKYGEIYFVTYRSKNQKEKTEKNLENKLPSLWQEIIFSNRNNKREIYEKLNPVLIIDDSSEQIKNAIELGFNFFLFNAPWNQEIDVGEKRAYGWKDIMKRFYEYL